MGTTAPPPPHTPSHFKHNDQSQSHDKFKQSDWPGCEQETDLNTPLQSTSCNEWIDKRRTGGRHPSTSYHSTAQTHTQRQMDPQHTSRALCVCFFKGVLYPPIVTPIGPKYTLVYLVLW